MSPATLRRAQLSLLFGGLPGAVIGAVFSLLAGWGTGRFGDALLCAAILVPITAAFFATIVAVVVSIFDGSAAREYRARWW